VNEASEAVGTKVDNVGQVLPPHLPWNGRDFDMNGDGIADQPIKIPSGGFTGVGVEYGPAADRIPGDANEDVKVAFDDFLILAQNFTNTDATWAEGDFNYSGSVDFTDFLILAENFGSTSA
jgi:hypothetical protein